MLAHRTSGAFICIQCRLRAIPFQKARSIRHRGPIARFSSTPLRPEGDEDLPEGQLQRPSPPIRKNFRSRKLRGNRDGSFYSEDAEPLSIASLGTPSEIIVLRDAGRNYKFKTSEGVANYNKDNEKDEKPKDGGEEASKQDDIFASLVREDATPEQEEINVQIESLRPETATDLNGHDEPVYLTNLEFKRIYDDLCTGFTGPQLSRYIADSTGIVKSGEDGNIVQGLIKASGSNSAQRARFQTEWLPGISPISSRLPAGDDAVLSRISKQRGGSKRLLANQILRVAWHITLLEEIEAPGELEISLKRWQLSLLFAGETPTPLDRIGKDRKAKIEIFWPHSVLRITADKNSAEYAARDVEAMLKDTERLPFDLEPWRPLLLLKPAPKDLTELYKPADFTLVEKMTGAVVEKGTQSTLIIRGLSNTQTADAYRSLLTMLKLDDRTSRMAITKFRSKSDRKEGTFVRTSSKNALEYNQRNLDLVRWTQPFTRSESSSRQYAKLLESSFDDDSQIEDITRAAGLPESSFDNGLRAEIMTKLGKPTLFSAIAQPPLASQDAKIKRPKWSDHVEMQTTAKLGHILHPFQTRSSVLSRFDDKGVDTSNSMAVFSNTTPGISHLLQTFRAPSAEINLENTLEYHFVASPLPGSGFDVKNKYPRLRLLVTMTREGGVRLGGVRLDLHEDYIDVLLPDQASDIRFRRRQSAYLYRAEGEGHVVSFFKAIAENIEGGGKLSAPSSLKLAIPTWTVISPTRTPFKRFKQDPLRTETVNFIFLGIQHRQTVLMPFGKHATENLPFSPHSLAYSGVEAGQLSGKYGEISLKYSKRNKSKDIDPKLANGILAHFVKSAFKAVDRISLGSLNPIQFSDFRPGGKRIRHSVTLDKKLEAEIVRL